MSDVVLGDRAPVHVRRVGRRWSSARCGRTALRCAGGSAGCDRSSPSTVRSGSVSRSHLPSVSTSTGTRSSAPERMKTSDSLGVVDTAGRPLSVLRVIDGKRQAPAEAERPVAGAGVVGERELRAEAGAAGAGGDRHASSSRCR